MTLPSTERVLPPDAQLAMAQDSRQRGLNPFTATGSLRRAARLLSRTTCRRSRGRDRRLHPPHSRSQRKSITPLGTLSVSPRSELAEARLHVALGFGPRRLPRRASRCTRRWQLRGAWCRRLVEEREGRSARGEPPLDDAARMFGLAVKEPDADREDLVEAAVSQIEVLESRD